MRNIQRYGSNVETSELQGRMPCNIQMCRRLHRQATQPYRRGILISQAFVSQVWFVWFCHSQRSSLFQNDVNLSFAEKTIYEKMPKVFMFDLHHQV